MELRPLDLAGMLSRAATIYAGSAGPFIAMVATAIVPLSVVQYFVAKLEQPQLDATLSWLQLPQSAQAAHLPPSLTSPNLLLLSLASAVLTYIVMGFAMATVGAGVAAYNRSEKILYGSCWTVALRHWRAIAGVVALVLLLGFAVVVAIAGIIFIPLAAVAALAPAATILVAAFGIFVLLMALCFAVTLLLVVGAAAIYAVTLEDRSPYDALTRTLLRTCNRSEAWRALICGSVVSAIVIAATAGVDILGFSLLQHREAVYSALDAVVRSAVVPFADIIFAVYYFDLRVRQEGFDLQMRVDCLGTHPANEIGYAPTRYLTGEERALVAAFIERREALTPSSRRDLAARIVAPARTRVPADLAAMEDEGLLERL